MNTAKQSHNRSRAGWTYIELILALAIVGVLIGLTTMNLLTAKSKSSQSTTVDSLASDMALQQTRAMSGDTSAAGTKSAYGIYFQSDRYVLFKGNAYSAADTENFTIPLTSVSFSSIG
ncbi:type II secretion system protein, partial [Candidatus Microgenomates bacterium]|nr:type II secretion system protein [Candidatus Microgenomates bacterium]